ncbi:L-ascorbate oxidase [Penicillium capsulatum]|uniref:L-ascorbate oxidase n=1 Tax=Penicillium capsulatum TaxID=69766 RepID=A0A9W9HVP2_9EURO|nr:L-ascorbate oxidase [Penicillium capsulatum]KAJ6106046.1 L-ascorbate oxidase [Penicillium capsulatum]
MVTKNRVDFFVSALGTTPGPTIRLRENKTTWIRVYNDFPTDNLTMHWHGLSQSLAPFSDGTPQASQWPIKAQHYFDYEIHPNVGEAGTYFYHSHVGFQAVSAAGPLIVEEQDGHIPYEYDDERVLFLSEAFNYTDKMVEQGMSIPVANFKWPGEAGSILVNGKSYRSLDGEKTVTSKPYNPESAPLPDEPCEPEIIKVKPNTTYRMRTIGGVALSPLVSGLEEHDNLTVIAADSHYTKPAETNMIQIGSGQRYDFILHTKTERELRDIGKSLFWMQIETRYRRQNNTFYALLSYETDDHSAPKVPDSPPEKRPITIPYSIQDWLEYTLEPIEDNNFPTADQVTRRVVLTSAQLQAKSGSTYWTINNRTWNANDQQRKGRSADMPYLVQIYKDGNRAIPDYDNAVQNHAGWDPQFNVYPARIGEVIDIILVNEPNDQSGGFDTHPWHIHGDHVYDLGSGYGTYDATANEKKLKWHQPVLRDTTFLFKYTAGEDTGAGNAYTSQGWRAWRLRVANAGVWMVHCHTLQHMINGMQSVWVMGNASEVTRNTSPELVTGYLGYGGNAYGNSTSDPLVTHHFSN